jgi:hypothetical protein
MLAEIVSQPIEIAVRELVAAAIAAHRIDPRLHRVLADEIPRIRKLESAKLLNREAYAVFRDYLEDHCDELGVKNLDLAAFVCITSIEAIAHTAVLYQPEMLRGSEGLIEEIARLISRYLQPRSIRYNDISAGGS